MDQALRAAHAALSLSNPNPRVGCVLLAPDGRVIGRGHTQQAGGPHAEVMALRDAAQCGENTRGATAFVTLEPCSHHGRTPPCCDALIDAGVGRVVVALADPNPLVGGRGLDRLRAAGISVDTGLREAEATELNIGFLHRMRSGLPYVRLKVAASMDGRSALADGRSQWITGPAARADGHAWRRRSGAVLTGIGTVLADDPRLDVREVPTARQPLRVVLDTRLRLPPAARIVAPPGSLRVYTATVDGERARALQRAGASLAAVPLAADRLDLTAVLRDLAAQGVNELHVEAGAQLNAAFVAADLVDEWLLYLAPMLIGPGRGVAELPALPTLADARRYRFVECTPLGDDLRLRARRLTDGVASPAAGPRCT